MTVSEFKALLNSMFEIPVTQVTDRSFKLPGRTTYLTACLCQDDQNVFEIKLCVPYGVITEPAASISLLMMNSGGILNHPYYWTAASDRGAIHLTMETTIPVVDLAPEQLRQLLYDYFTDSLLTREILGLPKGVVPL